jgi:RNA polymerase sigma-70 factor (ECF subfamily)
MCKYYNNNLATLYNLWETAMGDDHQAYTSLYTSLFPALYGYLMPIVKDGELANDLLQELFVKLWHKRKQIGTVNNVKAYFFTATRSMAISHFRKIKSQTLRLEHFTQPEADSSHEDLLVSAEEDRHLKYKMELALNTLPARQREIIHLKYYQGMEYDKIAEMTGIRYQSVINHVFRGLQTLRAEFRPYNTKVVA